MSDTRLEEIKQRNDKTKPGSIITFLVKNQGADLQQWVKDYHNDTSFLLQELNKLQQENEQLRQSVKPSVMDVAKAIMNTDIEILYEQAIQENERYKEALMDSHTALAAALIKNGGSMDFGYYDFFEMQKNGKFEFTKHENYENDTVTIKVRKLKEPPR